MNFAAIDIQGAIISSDILIKITQEDLRYQKAADFDLDRNIPLRDEISVAWAAAQGHYTAFRLRKERLKEHETGTSETRNSWMLPLMRELGYELSIGKAEIINEKSYAISHRADNRDGYPVHIVGVNQSLDKRAEHGARLSPHALVQEYLNNHDHLYAITTNGNSLRLLRDTTRLSRLSYLEFDLSKMMEEGLYAEFSIMYRVLHVSRMPVKQDAGEESIIEFYHQEALASGTRIRERLSEAVEQSIKLLGNGLLKNEQNKELRAKAMAGQLKADDYYLHLLRTVYRVLFLLVIEERNLIFPKERDAASERHRKLYYDYYSVQRLTRLAERRIYVDPRKTDLWRSLMATFLLFENGHYGRKLGIEPLGSGLFSSNALGDLMNQQMDNESLLKVIGLLVMFENEQKQRTRVNYADLDVEEFGSVYEGLLEYDPVISMGYDRPQFGFKQGDKRSSSGSHYTPEELVKPLIKHSLDYVIADKMKAAAEGVDEPYQAMQAQADALLTITVCDVACGSGHILLSTARRIGMELAVLRESIASRTPVEQPSPTALRAAIRDVIRHCIYGVDKNPLAVELCKVAFWLEAHSPGEPLNFLDHRVKCGDAIVGLAHKEDLKRGIATEAFKAISKQEKEEGLAKELSKRNRDEIKIREKADGTQLQTDMDYSLAEEMKELDTLFDAFVQLPEKTPKEIEAKQIAYRKLEKSKALNRLKAIADMQVAQFFLEKTGQNKDYLITDSDYFRYLRGEKSLSTAQEVKFIQLAQDKRFFHYFLEFPEVFAGGGFDAIVGNPPFLGGKRIKGTHGEEYLNYCKSSYNPAIGGVDLVAYFFRKCFAAIKEGGFQSMIATNTIAQGETRLGGLEVIINNSGTINHAVRSMPWPGLAAVEVALVSIFKGNWQRPVFLSNKETNFITPFLDDQNDLGNPFALVTNANKSFNGSFVLGTGFILNPTEAASLIAQNPKNKQVIMPYLNGVDLNSNPHQKPSRYVINFFDWEEDKAAEFEECYAIINQRVKPERTRWKKNKKGIEIVGTYALRKPLPEKWWIYADKRPRLYKTISKMNRVMVVAQVSRTLAFDFTSPHQVLDAKLVAFSFEYYWQLAVMQSTMHGDWAWKYCTTMKSDLTYAPTAIFQTFPFPVTEANQSSTSLDAAGSNYYKWRKSLMQATNLGLTKIHNQFHNQYLLEEVELLSHKDFQKRFGKVTWSLYNHLEVKQEGEVVYKKAVPRIFELRKLHKEMDEAVLGAYGWKDIDLRHDFYEVDYLPENDRVRYTIHPEARKEILKRLLLLNHERFEEEVAQGLHKKKDVVAYYKQKNKEAPEDVVFSDGKKGKRKSAQVKDAKVDYGLFDGGGNSTEE